uniref:Uncharacterized protein n=1 Tax=Rhizophora mucronata TaxID=61149 RepID=A0A2P2R2Y8_RHIMU
MLCPFSYIPLNFLAPCK